MEAKVENLEDNRSKVNVVVDAKDVDAKVKQVYRELASKYNFPGFRKGKAPRAVIDNALGKEVVLAQVTEDVINDAYPEAVEELKLYPVGSPDFADPGMIEPGKEFKFEFTVGRKPEIELTSYDPVDIELPAKGANDAEIDEQIDILRSYHEVYENAPADTVLAEDGYADIALTSKKEDGEEIAALTFDSRLYTPGTGIYPEDFDKELIGMKKDDEKKFTLEIPKDEKSAFFSDLAGQKVDFDVKCIVVKEKKSPEVTDEWVSTTFGYESVAKLREDMAKSIEDQKESMMPRLKETACGLKLVERVEDEVPENMAEEAESELLQDFFTQLQQQGASFDQYLAQRGIDSDQFKQDIKMQAQDEAKQQLALDAWARHNNIEATDEDVTLEFERAGLEDPKKTQEEWRKSGRLYLLREGITRRKAMENVMETAKVTEKEYVPEED